MNRNQAPIRQENYPYYQYVGAQQPIIPQGYIQNGSFYPVMQPMIMPLFQIQQNSNPNNKHQQQMISQQQQHQQQQPNSVIVHKKPTYTNVITSKPTFRPWTPEEDKHIMDMVKLNGLAFDIIARTLHDRSVLDVQKRYHELNNRFALPIPSIQARPMGAYYDDFDSNNENKEDNSSCFFKHVSYGVANNNGNFGNINRASHPSINQFPDDFAYIFSEVENDDSNNRNCCILQFASPDNEFNC